MRPDPYMEVTVVSEGQLKDHKRRVLTAIGGELLAGIAIVAAFTAVIAGFIWFIA